MKLRPLGIATEIIQATALNVTYNYDDLVFIEHNPFMIQFDDDNPNNLNLFFNTDCEKQAVQELEVKLNSAAQERGFTITPCGKFEMTQKQGTEEIDIKFIP